MSANNPNLVYRPLRGGVAILNPQVNHLGTLGFIATSDGLDRWLVSCCHVLHAGPPAAVQPVYQPVNKPGLNPVAYTDPTRADPDLDCAAAIVAEGVAAVGEILGLVPLAEPIDPQAGQRVIKSGCATGITEGTIRQIVGDRLEIAVTEGIPDDYELCQIGDSGAVWVDRESGAPVALHTAGSDTGEELAFGVRILKVLEVLGLTGLAPG